MPRRPVAAAARGSGLQRRGEGRLRRPAARELDQAFLLLRLALRAATVTPAEFFGLEEDMGTVEAGRLADLVLLGGNPLEDIRNTRSVEAVVLNGELLDRARLDALGGG